LALRTSIHISSRMSTKTQLSKPVILFAFLQSIKKIG